MLLFHNDFSFCSLVSLYGMKRALIGVSSIIASCGESLLYSTWFNQNSKGNVAGNISLPLPRMQFTTCLDVNVLFIFETRFNV